jgi:two-component system, chemotaxis family, response regulator Rcp1
MLSGFGGTVLVIEDSISDIRVMRDTFSNPELRHDFRFIADGELAMREINEGFAATGRLPDLIFLDLNLPRVGGLEILRTLKNHPQYAKIPVLILTSSILPEDVENAYLSHANCFLRKPEGLGEFRRLLEECCRFWLRLVRLPLEAAPTAEDYCRFPRIQVSSLSPIG